MVEVVKLVADAIVNTKTNMVKNPEIYIIINMMTEINEQAHYDCVSKLQD